jgi:hypothetical protein
MKQSESHGSTGLGRMRRPVTSEIGRALGFSQSSAEKPYFSGLKCIRLPHARREPAPSCANVLVAESASAPPLARQSRQRNSRKQR